MDSQDTETRAEKSGTAFIRNLIIAKVVLILLILAVGLAVYWLI